MLKLITIFNILGDYMTQVFNFSAGPATMPKDVLLQAQTELLNWKNQNTSVMEVSHRGIPFMELVKQAEIDLRNLYSIPDNYKIMFLQGGARGQFAAIPMNLANKKGKALYLTSGHWSKTAADEARLFCDVNEINILSDNEPLSISNLDFTEQAENYDYVHYCPNETISGLEIFDIPNVGNTTLIADMSSTILSRKIDINKFGMIYAGAQKNLGPSGVTIVIIREDLLNQARLATPSIWNYSIQVAKDSMINTPPTFAWYICALVFKYWLQRGGLNFIEEHNKVKAQLLYKCIDQSKLFKNNICPQNRSLMNITFTTGNSDLDTKFIQEANNIGLLALKGHKVLGGMRASIYNAMPLEGVKKLITFIEEFDQKNS